MSQVTQGGTPGGVATKKIYEFIYDFTVQGGTVAALALTALNGPVPTAFIVTNAFLDVITALTGGAGTTGAVSLESAGDLVIATVVAGAPFSTTGRKVTIALPGTLATWIKTTAARTPTITFAVNPATAGRLHLYIEGFQGE